MKEGTLIKRTLKQHGYTQKEIADLLGVNEGRIKRMYIAPELTSTHIALLKRLRAKKGFGFINVHHFRAARETGLSLEQRIKMLESLLAAKEKIISFQAKQIQELEGIVAATGVGSEADTSSDTRD